MKRNIFYIISLCLSVWLTGCSQLEVEKYENDSRLYFFKGAINDWLFQGDSIVHSFFLQPDGQMSDTILVDIRTMGFPADFPRPFRIIQTNAGESDAAVAGKHYLDFASEEMQKNLVMPAGAIHLYLPVIVKRDPSLELSKVRLQFAIVENEYFSVGINEQSTFLVTTTAQAEKPALWDTYWKYSFGDFGVKKLWFLIHYLGISDFSSSISDSGYEYYLRARVIQALADYNTDEKNPDRPLREADGTLVTFN